MSEAAEIIAPTFGIVTKQHYKVMLAIPSGRDWKRHFGMSLVGLLITQDPDLDIQVLVNTELGSLLVNNRHRLAHAALWEGCSHILWLDDDMQFPPDTLSRLLKRDLDFVGANCVIRTIPPMTTAVKDGEKIKSNGKTGIEEVDHLGLAITLTKTDIFKKLPAPWFATPYDPKITYAPDDKRSNYVGEDVFFCRMAKHFGVRMYVDHDLSMECGHVGDLNFNHHMIEE